MPRIDQRVLHATWRNSCPRCPPERLGSILGCRCPSFAVNIRPLVSTARTEGLPASDTVHQDAALLTALRDYIEAVIAPYFLNKSRMALTKMGRRHLALTWIIPFPGSQGFSIDPGLVVFPKLPIPLSLASLIHGTNPVLRSPEPIKRHPNLRRPLGNPHRNVPPSSEAPSRGCGTPSCVRPDAQLVTQFHQLMRRFRIRILPLQRRSEVWPSSMVTASISVEALESKRFRPR